MDKCKAIAYLMFFCICWSCKPIFGQEIKPNPEKATFWKYKLKPNESLSTVAKKYNLSQKELLAHNKLSSNYTLTDLDYLKILVNNKGKSKYILYRVQETDSLDLLIKKYNTSSEEISLLNQKSLSEIRSGTLLLFPHRALTPQGNKSIFSGFLSGGYHASNSYNGENIFYYTLNARINYRKTFVRNKIKNRFRTQSSLGFRHQLGRPFSKYIDRYEFSNNLEFHVSKYIIPFVFGSFKSQYANTIVHYGDNEKQLISGPFSPAYSMLALGFSHYSEYVTLDIGLYELKTTVVLNEELFQSRSEVFGVMQGKNVHIEHGMSFRADLYFYKDEKISIQSNLYAFINPKFVDLDFNFELGYNIAKYIRISSILEIYHDRFFSDDIQYRNELVIGISLFK